MEKNEDLKFLSFLCILLITMLSASLNFDIDMKSIPKYTFISLIYLFSWILFVLIALKHNHKSMITFLYIFWIPTLITSIFMIISNITSLPNIFIIFIYFIIFFITPLKGFSFSNSSIVVSIIFSIISIVFIITPFVYKLIYKLINVNTCKNKR